MTQYRREVGPQLLGGAFAPLTDVLLFVEAPVERVVDAFALWQVELGNRSAARVVSGSLGQGLEMLAPLKISVERMLFVGTRGGEWTAVFAGSARGNDPTNPVKYQASVLGVRALALTYRRDVPESSAYPSKELSSPEQLGARIFTASWPGAAGQQVSRSIYLARQSGKRWRFDLSGTPLEFERPEVYKSRLMKERFTPELLVEYAKAWGVDPFGEDFYTGPMFLVEVHNPRLPAGEQRFSLREAQARLGIGALYPDEEVSS